MVFYVEACESGSMFDNLLPKDINGNKDCSIVFLEIGTNEIMWICVCSTFSLKLEGAHVPHLSSLKFFFDISKCMLDRK